MRLVASFTTPYYYEGAAKQEPKAKNEGLSNRSYTIGRTRNSYQRKNLVVLAIKEFYGDLDSTDSVLVSEINSTLRMLKIVPFLWIGRPVAQTSEIQLRARVL